MHPLLERLFEAWDSNGIGWCFLRLPADPGAPESDVDLLVDPAGLERAVALAEQQEFARLPGRHVDTHLITYHRQTARWLWLHCVTELAFGPYRALRGDPTAHVLRRRLNGSPALLAPEDEFWVTLAHVLLDHRKIAVKHRRRLAVLAPRASTGGALASGFTALLPAGRTSADLVQAVRREEWADLEDLVSALHRSSLERSRPSLIYRAVQLVRRLPARVRYARLRRGTGVALLGPDGAGKSTLMAGLERTFVFPVQPVYMGLTGGMLTQVDRLRVPGVVQAGRLLVIWSRYLRARYHMARGRLVVFDRYIYDAEVPTPYRLGPVERLGRWIDGRSCPAPDMILVLDAPGTVMHERKGEYTPEMLEDWRQRFLSLRERLPGVEVIDTTRGIDAVRNDVTERVWRRYAQRWRTR